MIPRTVYLLHGYNVKDDGLNTTGLLIQDVRDAGHIPIPITYGYVRRPRVRLCNPCIASTVADMAVAGSVAIGHSNGGALAWLASNEGAFDRLILINPALDVDVVFADHLNRVDVYHSPDDVPTWVAQWIPGSPWGAMGRYGYRGGDDRVHNHNLREMMNRPVGHSDALRSLLFRTHLAESL